MKEVSAKMKRMMTERYIEEDRKEIGDEGNERKIKGGWLKYRIRKRRKGSLKEFRAKMRREWLKDRTR